MKGSYTANLCAGIPARTTNWAIRWMLGNTSSWSIPTSATAGTHPSALQMLCSLVCIPCGQTQCPQHCPTHGTTQERLHRYGLELVPPPSWESPQTAQGALAGKQGWCQPHSSPPQRSQQIHLSSPSSTTLLMSHLPCALAPTQLLPHLCPKSLIHSACKEGDGTLPN